LGLVLGGGDFFLFGSHLSDKDFETWGWRLVFITGAWLGLIVYLMRRKLRETQVFQKMKESHEILHDPIWVLFAKYKKRLAQLCGLTILETVGYNLIIPFSILYLTDVLEISFHHALQLNLLRLAVILLILPFAGMLASRFGPKRLAVWTAWCFVILPLPLHWLMYVEKQLVLTSIAMALLQGCYMATLPATSAALFPAQVRFSGIAIAYNATVGILGGFIPLAALGVIHSFGTPLIPPFLLIAAALIALITLRSIRDQPAPL
jgi:MHS family proline/betaine transporter-like MFS transporter